MLAPWTFLLNIQEFTPRGGVGGGGGGGINSQNHQSPLLLAPPPPEGDKAITPKGAGTQKF